ncbi:Transcriptional regulator, LacI family [Alteracholeplasma palmae J233]|uniref:Transcriptional regulator, LacI family n=1 Tax=Alteracholeplasma palmae (strain ATCC 49389 / J233) TaxID=1318466 RepID=U4KQZ7_ALTPJ|nr:LacI family DNA-binding transcriptional regulator [Alteracholeplasma palmae]CCV63736.1 Transcriptional regulator, LacI family [Alteracholeplasma palmae J233]
MAITIKEIAKLANTSRGTVDRVINHRGGVSKEVEEKVLQIIKENNYQYNQYARALVNSKKMYKVGVVLTAYNSDFYTRVLKGVRHSSQKEKNKQLELLTKVTNYAVKSQLNAINELYDEGIQALIINPIYDNEIKTRLEEINIPIVMIGNKIEISNLVSFVGCDYYNNGTLAGDVAGIISNHQKILIITGQTHPLAYEKRVKGFKDQLSENQLIDYLKTNDSDKDTYEKVKQYFKQNSANLIYFSTGNGIGGGIKAITDLKLDTKVIATDEHPDVITGLKNGQVVITITQQPEKQGISSVDIIRKYLILNEVAKKEHIIGNKIKLKHSNFNEIL